jgi:hypothetical protein
MLEFNKLVSALFTDKRERLVNVKFCVANSSQLTPESLCKEINDAMQEVSAFPSRTSTVFETKQPVIDVRDYVESL